MIGRRRAATEEEQWLAQIDPARLPRHIAIIMDGNGRWARQRHMPRSYGHLRGAEVVERFVKACQDLPKRLAELGKFEGEAPSRIGYVTMYSFSSENWNRPREEVDTILSLIERKLREKLGEFNARGIRLRLLGRERELPTSLRAEFGRDMEATAGNEDLQVHLAVNYGGRGELVDAAKRLAQQVQAGTLALDDIDEAAFAGNLYAPGVPDPELLMRTGGELRVSNFLLWQIAYAELWVTPTLWPALTTAELYKAIAEYQGRERRFGGVGSDGAR